MVDDVKRRPAPEVVSPSRGGAFHVARSDFAEAIRLSPVWLHAGWIEIVWRFRRTRLGPFWHTLGLAAFIVVVGVVWSAMLHIDLPRYFRYVTVSLIVWTLIASFVTEGTNTIIAGQATALSMRYPYLAFAFAHAWRTVLLFAHHFVLYILVLICTLYWPGPNVIAFVPALAIVIANGVWMTLLVAMMSLRRRDLIPGIAALMQILMFVTPVFWPKDLLGPRMAFAADLNPFYHLVTIAREPLLGTLPQTESWAWALGTLVLGGTATAWVYGRWRDRLAYWY